MKERPMIFNAEMVSALLSGNKTLTRRPMKPQPHEYKGGIRDEGFWWHSKKHGAMIPVEDFQDPTTRLIASDACPLGGFGDRIWVRETCCIAPKRFAEKNDSCLIDDDGEFRHVSYRADGQSEEAMRDYGLKWTPSIHMPRWASRISLEITDVRVERVQEISEEDAKSEGFDLSQSEAAMVVGWCEKPRKAFSRTWDAIYGDFDQNPWVWVIEFKRVEDKS